MLGLLAPYIAKELYPELDLGLIAQFATVHDMTESVTGDVSTFKISEEERIKKEAAEKEALKILQTELPTYWADLLVRYETQTEPEARFVKVVDKIMPALMHMHGDGLAMFSGFYGVNTAHEVLEGRRPTDDSLMRDYPEFAEVIEIRKLMSVRSVEIMFG